MKTTLTLAVALMSLACTLQANTSNETSAVDASSAEIPVSEIAAEAPAIEYGVKGCVVDSLTHEGEPMATVRIWKSGVTMTNDKVAAAGTTDVDGNFEFVIKQKGDYVLVITSIGRTPITRMFTVNKDKQNANLGTMLIAESAQNLEDVVIAIQKPLVKMSGDKISYSVKDDPDAKTNTVLEMLRKVPMVTVDGEENITVNGSSSFQVFMNGKPSAMLSGNPKETLKALPAESIKHIEVLTNPGAKYDAEGVGGILNIVTETQQGMEGYTANVQLQGGNRMNGGSVYVMTQRDKLTLSVNAREGYMMTPAVEATTERDQLTDGQHMESATEMKSGSNMAFANVDATYQIDDNNVVSASIGVMDMRSNSTTDVATTFSYPEGSALQMPGFEQTNDNHTTSTSVNGSVDYMHNFNGDPYHTLTAAYRVSTSPRHNNSSTEYSLATMPAYDQTDRNNMIENTLQLDYVLPILDNQTFETGGKYVWRNSTSKSDLLDYTHNSQVGALYTTYAIAWNNYNMKAGVRYEHTAQDVSYKLGNGNDFSLTYDNVVPNLSLSFSPTMTQNLNLSYNMRISRPGISVLNPYRNTQNVTNVSYGNPDLEVEKVHNTQLTYNYYSMNLMLNATLLYSYQDNGIEQYSFIDNNVLYSTYGNIAKRQNTSLSLFASLSLSPSTRLTLNSTTSYVDLEAETKGLSNNGWQQTLMANVQQNLPWNMKLSAMYMLNTPSISLQGNNSGINIHTIGLTKSALNDRLSISINAVNPFKSTMHMDVKSAGADFKQTSTTNIKMCSVIASVSYRFGNMKMQQKRSRTSSNDDLYEVKDNSVNSVFM